MKVDDVPLMELIEESNIDQLVEVVDNPAI